MTMREVWSHNLPVEPWQGPRGVRLVETASETDRFDPELTIITQGVGYYIHLDPETRAELAAQLLAWNKDVDPVDIETGDDMRIAQMKGWVHGQEKRVEAALEMLVAAKTTLNKARADLAEMLG